MISLKDKTVLITGATNGIGLVTAKELAKMEAEIYLIGRNPKKGERTIRFIKKNTGNAKLHFLICDLSSLRQVRAMAQEFRSTGKQIDILINNAGVFNTKRRLTQDNYEEMFAVNHLAHFLLTTLLLDKMGDDARIINVASGAHILVKEINFMDLNFGLGFNMLKVYSHSKLANILFTHQLAKSLKDSKITVNAVDPGEVSTGLGRQNKGLGKILYWLMNPFIQTPDKGARTSVYVATSPKLDGVTGRYFRDCKQKQPKPWALDDQTAKRLWEVSQEMVDAVR